MKISGVLPIRYVSEDSEGLFTLEAERGFMMFGDDNVVYEGRLVISNINSEFRESLRIGKPIKFTVEVADGGTTEN